MTTSTTFDIDVNYRYTKAVIPPRCRRPRDQQFDDTLTVSIPVVTSEQAPVVIRLPHDPRRTDGPVVELRGHNGSLYEPLRAPGDYSNADYAAQAVVRAGSDDFPAQVTDRAAGYRAQDYRASEIREQYARLLIIDEMVWTRTEEPCYEVMTFGMGANHGGTALFIARYPHNEMTTHPATDHTAAIEHAVQVATDRGDNESIERIRATAVIEVLDPAYVNRTSHEDVHASKERALLAEIEQVKAALDATDDGRKWFQRISDAQSALERARSLAWEL